MMDSVRGGSCVTAARESAECRCIKQDDGIIHQGSKTQRQLDGSKHVRNSAGDVIVRTSIRSNMNGRGTEGPEDANQTSHSQNAAISGGVYLHHPRNQPGRRDLARS